MKKIFTLIAFALIASVGFAQDATDVQAELKALQDAFGKDKAELVKQYMAIPAEKMLLSGVCMISMRPPENPSENLKRN